MGSSTDRPRQRLADYRDKRDFTRTSEPSGGQQGKGGHRFVVQRHRASRRHYDLRLELGGVLVSWAVPKGPTLDPTVRRMAVHVEDHPVEYIDFEGVIPKGQYGGGDVIVWDNGTWEPARTDDPVKALESGELHFDLYGQKLAGRFVMVRTGKESSAKQWLLLHKDDTHARRGWDAEDHLKSVTSGRTNEQVAATPEAQWHSDRSAEKATTTPRQPATSAASRGRKWRRPSQAEFAALDEMGRSGTWRVAGRDIALSNLNKVLFPADGEEKSVTKRELIHYYARIAPVLLPYLADRPLNVHRFPDGVNVPGFWQKELPRHAPDWLRSWYNADAKPREAQHYVVPDGVPALVWLANYGALELHAWTSRVAHIERPTWALFDIDPGTDTTFDQVRQLARLHHTALDHLGMLGKAKVTGQHGIQIWVPIEARYSYEQTRKWVETVSRTIGATVPELISWSWDTRKRQGRARLDYTQNVIGKTLVAPYSLRPRPGAPVSVPIEWEELDDPELRPDGWTIRSVFDRLDDTGDPFADLLGRKQKLTTL